MIYNLSWFLVCCYNFSLIKICSKHSRRNLSVSMERIIKKNGDDNQFIQTKSLDATIIRLIQVCANNVVFIYSQKWGFVYVKSL